LIEENPYDKRIYDAFLKISISITIDVFRDIAKIGFNWEIDRNTRKRILRQYDRPDLHKNMKEIDLIDNIDFYNRVVEERIAICGIIEKKLEEPIQPIPEKQYYDDLNDPPIPTDFKTFQFVECDNYLTPEGILTFNFDYFIKIYQKLE
jgi:hypothetical protein